jgi:hypothetical protein
MNPRILFDPNAGGGGGAFALPTPAAAPGEVISVISSDPAPAAPAQAAPAAPAPAQIPQGNNAVQPETPNEHNVIIKTEDDPSWDPWKNLTNPPAPDAQQQPAPQQAAPAPDNSAQIPGSITSPDGQWLNIHKPNPRTGQMEFYTRIANTPESVHTYVQNQLAYIDQLRMQPPPQQVQQAQPPPPERAEQTEREVQELARLAAEAYGDDTEVEPLAKFGAKLLKLAKQDMEQKSAQDAFLQKQTQEYQSIRTEDPTFDLSVDSYGVPRNHLAHQIMLDYPQLGAREVHAMYSYWKGRYEAANGRNGNNGTNTVQPAQPAPAPAPAPAATPQPDPRLYTRPTGTGGPAPTSQMADSAYVRSCVESCQRMMGNKATPALLAQVRNDAIALERAGGNQGQ